MAERPLLDVVVVEDEERARSTLRRLLGQDAEVRVVAETSGAEAPDVIREREPDILFLDVQMPGLDGFGVLRSLEPDEVPSLVFVTAWDRYALDAFDAAAVDYLLKPFSDSRFREALSRAKERARSRGLTDAADAVRRLTHALGEAPPEPRQGGTDRIAVRDAGRTLLLSPGEVEWVEADGVYVRLHLDRRNLLVRETLTAMEERLAPHGFFRIHRSTLVNLDRVVELRHRSHGDYSVLLRGGTELTLSRTRRKELEERLGESLSGPT